ncbi:uncharacterized protein EI97DRAFT_492555 [Westerdykella ornata]|uniref:Uncharacterized protein n=1 Tax=Westerdykella ornata TaxID=318751 RepID=A0A6A6JRC5_WESOR|nr:uncharacterized protein EI97DRAFT_492555 [Westerdykella ornata]KAF2278937.1 hypothetical protein EI97DRAFT_492555 [Westerdykella ornata]
MSSSPAAKRSLKPSPAATNPQQNTAFTTSAELPTLQPAAPVAQAQPQSQAQESLMSFPRPSTPGNSKKRKSVSVPSDQMAATPTSASAPSTSTAATQAQEADAPAAQEPKAKKSRTNTPWTPAEEQRLKAMRDAGNSWNEIAKTFPQRTEGSVKKHWYKDMHYAEFAEDESAALLAAIKEYDQNKWKVIGQKVGKPAKACEQYAKEHFGGKV